MSLKNQWEGDLGFELSEEIWDRALDRVHSSSICLHHKIIQFKIIIMLIRSVTDCDRQTNASHPFTHVLVLFKVK